MKKLLLSIIAVASWTVAVNAQQCGFSSCSPQSFSSVGLHPAADSLPCFVRGVAANQTLYFQNYATYTFGSNTLNVDSIRIDTVLLTPGICNNGLFWAMNNPRNIVAGGGSGCINISGTVPETVPAGQYKLHIEVMVWTSGGDLPPIHFTSEGLNLNYYIRVVDADSVCPAVVDTANTPVFLSYYGESLPATPGACASCTVGIDDIAANVSQLSVQPNPFGTATIITFSAEKRENYSLKLMNLLGEVIYSKDITATAGKNAFSVENKGYSNGVYLLSLTNGKSSVTKRVVIAE